MKCPECGYPESTVIDSRRKNGRRWRRRECDRCHHRFNTYEVDAAHLKSLESERNFVMCNRCVFKEVKFDGNRCAVHNCSVRDGSGCTWGRSGDCIGR